MVSPRYLGGYEISRSATVCFSTSRSNLMLAEPAWLRLVGRHSRAPGDRMWNLNFELPAQFLWSARKLFRLKKPCKSAL